MNYTKNKSITSDTRATGSVHLSGQPRIVQQIQHSENCEVEFLRRKNSQLQEKVGRMTQHIATLEKNKQELLSRWDAR